MKYLQIQTKEECNLKCRFCPNSYLKQSGNLMKESTFDKILKDLKGYKGSFALHLMNEPTLDKRIPKFIKKIRDKFKTNRIYISTNGTRTDEKYLRHLMDLGVTELSISCYTKDILDKYKHMSSDNIHIHNFINPPESFYNRGGNIEVSQRECSGYCERPFETMYIKWDGKAVLCCSDYKGEVVMGDVNKDSMTDIFNNKKYKVYREHLKQGKRDLPLCNKCNYESNKLQ